MELSIIIPVCISHIKYVDRCLHSLFRNKHLNKSEIILVVSECKRNLKTLGKYKNIKIVTSERKLSPAEARNLGIRESCGKWLIFLDVDCIVNRNYISQILATIKNNPNINSITGEVVPQKISNIWQKFEGTEHKKAFQKYVYSLEGKKYSKVLKGANCIIKRKLLEKHRGFDEKYPSAEDRELGSRLFLSGNRILFEPKIKVMHMYHKSLSKIIKRHVWHSIGNSLNYVNHPEIFNHPFKGIINYILDGIKKYCKRKASISFIFYRFSIGIPYLFVFTLYYIKNRFKIFLKNGYKKFIYIAE